MQGPIQVISIHALREEGDHGLGQRQSTCQQFLSTPSARRATVWVSANSRQFRFLSTPSARRATGQRGRILQPCVISIHALREEGDEEQREEMAKAVLFLSTPSARRATFQWEEMRMGKMISIHALREEGDHSPGQYPGAGANFYPRPPRGGRQEAGRISFAEFKFLSTPSARRATAKTETKSLFSNKLYNILHEFRRALIYNGSKNYPNHAK